jgi:hypothetical protein
MIPITFRLTGSCSYAAETEIVMSPRLFIVLRCFSLCLFVHLMNFMIQVEMILPRTPFSMLQTKDHPVRGQNGCHNLSEPAALEYISIAQHCFQYSPRRIPNAFRRLSLTPTSYSWNRRLHIVPRVGFPLLVDLLLRQSLLDFGDGNQFFDFHDLAGDIGGDGVEDCLHSVAEAKGFEDALCPLGHANA